MNREEIMEIIKQRRSDKWTALLNPWSLQEDLLWLAAYIEQTDNLIPAPELQAKAKAQETALKALKNWIVATFGPNAAFGPPRDLLKDKWTITPKAK